jgi:hypothetical protein
MRYAIADIKIKDFSRDTARPDVVRGSAVIALRTTADGLVDERLLNAKVWAQVGETAQATEVYAALRSHAEKIAERTLQYLGQDPRTNA